tara:strand:+ start:1365 stop:1631 length:267 start_codon:yes stop_codon:yes gene_type:complete
MTDYPPSDSEIEDPTYHPPTDSESESDTESISESDDDNWFLDNGDPEDALQTGLLSFVANRKHLDADYVPLYIDLLRNLLEEAERLYK